MAFGVFLQKLVLGRRLANREFSERKIGELEGVPAMGLDGLASAAYGPEAALAILMPLGAAGSVLLGWIMLPILVLLGILYVSYRQTIRAYPGNGGAYMVAKENLGTNVSLLAAAALMIDYVLNVAVGISAGVAALTSAIPALHPYTLPLCLGILAVLTVANLRGTRDAGRILAVPTYLFIGGLGLVLAIGLAKALGHAGGAAPVAAPPAAAATGQAAGLWLILRAFASGCTAMTGIEAVSNGVGAFRSPVVDRAHRVLTAIVVVLSLLLAGIAGLCAVYHLAAMDQSREGYQSVLSQLTGAVVGRGAVYYVVIGSVLSVLCLSANTSFVGFPQLCRMVAQDEFLPRPFAQFGRRLVSSVGILYLAAAAGTLLIVFGGITDRLIPLFAIGAFLTFTISQSGMVVHWSRQRQSRWAGRAPLAMNAVGAAATGLALAMIVVAKFTEGAWITLLVIPCVIALLKTIKSYYLDLAAQMREEGPLDLSRSEPPVVLVPTQGWCRPTDRALQFATRLSSDVIAVHFLSLSGPEERERKDALRRQWAEDVETPARRAGLEPPRLVLLAAPYRRIQAPLLRLIEEIGRAQPGRRIAVVVPELVKVHWWQHLLHNRDGYRLRSTLLRYGGTDLMVVSIPWYLEEPRIEEGLQKEREEVRESLVPAADQNAGGG